VNVLPLQLVGQARGYQSKSWGTFNRRQSLGRHVMKRHDHITVGQYGTRRVPFKPVTKARRQQGREGWEGKSPPSRGNFVAGGLPGRVS
jgi:hypothetical protein